MRRGYDRVEGSIGSSYDEIKGVTMYVSRDFYMLGKITTGKKVKKFDCLTCKTPSSQKLVDDTQTVNSKVNCLLQNVVVEPQFSLTV